MGVSLCFAAAHDELSSTSRNHIARATESPAEANPPPHPRQFPASRGFNNSHWCGSPATLSGLSLLLGCARPPPASQLEKKPRRARRRHGSTATRRFHGLRRTGWSAGCFLARHAAATRGYAPRPQIGVPSNRR